MLNQNPFKLEPIDMPFYTAMPYKIDAVRALIDVRLFFERSIFEILRFVFSGLILIFTPEYAMVIFPIFYDYIYMIFGRNVPVFNPELAEPFELDIEVDKNNKVTRLFKYRGRLLCEFKCDKFNSSYIIYLISKILKSDNIKQYQIDYIKKRASLIPINRN